MLTDRKAPKKRMLSHEILCLTGIAAAVSLILFLILSGIATAVAETYCFNNNIPMTEFDWMDVDRWIFTVSAVLSCLSFSALFLFLLHDRIGYIRTITKGIGQLHTQQQPLNLPLVGNNELTALADAVNRMSATQAALREKELALAREKEQLIRTLSHDIRTPLTAILSCSEYLSTREDLTPGEQREYWRMVQKKAEQIRDLTDILLDGNRRNPEAFADARLLMEQLAAEFAETLENQFILALDLSGCPAFSGVFDVQELRRIFDNLSSNVCKYADPAREVTLSVSVEAGCLRIFQQNAVITPKPQSESFRIGLNSIRRIIQLYHGQVDVAEDDDRFSISISIPIAQN